MILVSCPLKQSDIVKLIENHRINGEKVFTLRNKKGVNLFFDCRVENDEESCLIIKNIIKSYKYSPALMYNVVTCDGEKVNWYK